MSEFITFVAIVTSLSLLSMLAIEVDKRAQTSRH